MKTLISIALLIIISLKIIFGVVDTASETVYELNNKTETVLTQMNVEDEAQFIY